MVYYLLFLQPGSTKQAPPGNTKWTAHKYKQLYKS